MALKRSKALGVALAALAVVAAGAYGWSIHRASTVRREPGLNVLLITIDTLRADALGSYGNPRVATPFMDRLADGGVRFESAHAHNVVTLPSHANILSGRLPLDHGVRDNSGFRFPEGADTLATLLKNEGYATAAFVSAFPLESRFGLTRGFDVYDDRFGGSGESVAFHMEERRGAETVAAARRWLDANAGRRTFAWIHLYDPHAPYAPPEPFASRFAGEPYLGEVSATDAALAPVIEPLLAAGDRGRTLVVLTSDHGEALGEHKETTHGIFAYQGTLRVPLILFAPGRLPKRVVAEPAQHVDIAPTVLDLLGRAAEGRFAGRSLLGAIAGGEAPARTTYFEALSASLNRGWAPLHGVIRGGYKYLELPLPELFDLRTDPKETRNLVARDPVRAGEMRSLLRQIREADRGIARRSEDADVREKLRGLGYISGEPSAVKTAHGEADDPKNLIEFDNLINDVIARYSTGDLAGAMQVSEDLVRRKPDMGLARMHYGFLLRQSGNLGAAIDQLRQALTLNPADTDVVALLGVYLNEAGRFKEAIAVLEAYAGKPDADVEVLVAYGMNLAGAGRGPEAIAAFERVRALDPSNAMALVNIGTVHLMAGGADQAAAFFRQALAANPNLARAHNSLGVIAAQAGRYDEAVAEWRRAVELEPAESQTLFNLGTLLVRMGRPAEARDYLARYLRVAPPATDRADIARVRQWLERSE